MKILKKPKFLNYYLNIIRPDLINNNRLSNIFINEKINLIIFSNFGSSNFEDLKIFKLLKLFFILSKEKPYFSDFASLKKERHKGGIYIGKIFNSKNFFNFLDYLYFYLFQKMSERYVSYNLETKDKFLFKISDMSIFSIFVEDIFKNNFSFNIKSKQFNKNNNSIYKSSFVFMPFKKYKKKLKNEIFKV